MAIDQRFSVQSYRQCSSSYSFSYQIPFHFRLQVSSTLNKIILHIVLTYKSWKISTTTTGMTFFTSKLIKYLNWSSHIGLYADIIYLKSSLRGVYESNARSWVIVVSSLSWLMKKWVFILLLPFSFPHFRICAWRESMTKNNKYFFFFSFALYQIVNNNLCSLDTKKRTAKKMCHAADVIMMCSCAALLKRASRFFSFLHEWVRERGYM